MGKVHTVTRSGRSGCLTQSLIDLVAVTPHLVRTVVLFTCLASAGLPYSQGGCEIIPSPPAAHFSATVCSGFEPKPPPWSK